MNPQHNALSVLRFRCQTSYKLAMLSLRLQAPTGTGTSDGVREVHSGVAESGAGGRRVSVVALMAHIISGPHRELRPH